MDRTAYAEYAEESSDWLKVGRTRFLGDLLTTHRPRAGALEALEVGAGVGQNLPTLAQLGAVDACEINPIGQEAIRAQGIARRLYSDPIPFPLETSYDVVCAMDVVEHIEDDREALRWLVGRLHRGGILIVTVPAYAWLFSDHDRALHHFRRYTTSSLRAALPDDVEVATLGYFNHILFPAAVAARAAWSLKRLLRPGHVGKQRTPTTGVLPTVFGKVLDLECSLIRAGYRPPWGLSAYCVARRR